MAKSYLGIVIALFIQVYSLTAFSKTFSCNGTYEDVAGNPFPSIHAEQDYLPGEAHNFELSGEDSRFSLKGYLKIEDNKEYLSIELVSKENGFTIYNNNSQIGQPIANGFNFVFLGMKNVGKVVTAREVSLEAVRGSFQCQTY